MITVHDVRSGIDYLIDQDDAGNILISDTTRVIGIPGVTARTIASVIMAMTADREPETINYPPAPT